MSSSPTAAAAVAAAPQPAPPPLLDGVEGVIVLLGRLLRLQFEAVTAHAAAVVVEADAAALLRHEALGHHVAHDPALDAAAGGIDGCVLEAARAIASPVVSGLRRDGIRGGCRRVVTVQPRVVAVGIGSVGAVGVVRGGRRGIRGREVEEAHGRRRQRWVMGGLVGPREVQRVAARPRHVGHGSRLGRPPYGRARPGPRGRRGRVGRAAAGGGRGGTLAGVAGGDGFVARVLAAHLGGRRFALGGGGRG